MAAAKRVYRRVPSPRVCAALVLLNVLDPDPQKFPSTEDLTFLVRSKVLALKRARIKQQVDQFTSKLRERCRKIVERFQNPNPKLADRARAMSQRQTEVTDEPPPG